jgi:hypothetical protein
MKKLSKKFNFLLEVTEDHPNLIILASSKDCVLAYSIKSHKMHYLYKVNDEISFDFSLLCEVGQNYQYWFKMIIEKLNLKIISKTTETDYFEAIVLE